MEGKWIPAPSQTLDDLYAQDPPYRCLHNGTVYVGIVRLEAVPEGLCYVVQALGAARPTKLLGSAVVTPVTPAPPPRYL